MKNILILFILTFTLSCCNNDDTPKPIILPIQQLPPVTQIGANTFGCLLDGQPFLPGVGTNPLDCQYQLVNGDYYFTLQANKKDIFDNFIALGIGTQKLQIFQNQTYSIVEKLDGKTFGLFYFNTIFNYTSQIEMGQLTISKLDLTNQIVSGTFWYDVKDSFGVIHQIREGRFDMRYTM